MSIDKIEEYHHQSLYDIQCKYIKDIFYYFCSELNKVHKDPNQIVELVNKQIDNRIYGIGLIHDWRVRLKDPITKQEIRDITLNNILEDRKNTIKWTIEFYFMQRRGTDIEVCEFIITG